jgi:hypothetical protein
MSVIVVRNLVGQITVSGNAITPSRLRNSRLTILFTASINSSTRLQAPKSNKERGRAGHIIVMGLLVDSSISFYSATLSYPT